MRDALLRWAEHVAGIVEGRKGKVLPLKVTAEITTAGRMPLKHSTGLTLKRGWSPRRWLSANYHLRNSRGSDRRDDHLLSRTRAQRGTEDRR